MEAPLPAGPFHHGVTGCLVSALAAHSVSGLTYPVLWSSGKAHRPLAQSGLSCPNLRTLLRPDAPVCRTPSSLALAYSGRFLPSRAVRLTFPSLLCHPLRACHDLYPAGGSTSRDGSSVEPGSLHQNRHGSAVQGASSPDSEGIVSRGGNLLVRLRPARLLGLLSGPRRFATGQPIYSRACSSEGLPAPESAMTSRLNHLLPRQDFHLLACQRSKAALGSHFLHSRMPRAA